MSDHQQMAVTASLDGLAGLAVLGSLFGYLPDIAAVLGIIWYLLQIWESQTVRDWRKRRHRRHSP